jgi:hypothetical protein
MRDESVAKTQRVAEVEERFIAQKRRDGAEFLHCATYAFAGANAENRIVGLLRSE